MFYLSKHNKRFAKIVTYVHHITYVNIFLENIHNINIIIMTRRIQGSKIEPCVKKGIYCQKMFRF